MSTGSSLSICMLSDDFSPAATGVGTHVQAISEHLTARGHQVLVVSTRRPDEPAFETWRGVQVARVRTLRVAGFYQALPSRRELGRLLADFRPDLVHHHYLGLMMGQGMAVARRLSLPQVYTYHMTEDHLTQPWPLRPLRRLVASGIVRWCNQMDQVISVSSRLADSLPAKGITAPVLTISNPVVFPEPDLALPADRDGDFIVFFAGRLNPEKNLPLLLRAFARLSPQVPGARLWIAGQGSQREALQNLAASLSLADKVRFLGFLDHGELARRYAACDVFVLPSYVETQGLVAMEAMWYGKPILVADTVVSAPELVDEGINGHTVAADDPADLARRLQQLAQDPVACAHMGQAGRTKAQGYRPGPLMDRLEALYRRQLRPAKI